MTLYEEMLQQEEPRGGNVAFKNSFLLSPGYWARHFFSLLVDLTDFNEQVRRKSQNTLLNLTFLCVVCLLV